MFLVVGIIRILNMSNYINTSSLWCNRRNGAVNGGVTIWLGGRLELFDIDLIFWIRIIYYTSHRVSVLNQIRGNFETKLILDLFGSGKSY